MRYFALFILTATTVWAAPPASKVWPMSDEGTAWMIENMPNAENIGYPVGEQIPSKLPPGYCAVVEVPAYIELFSQTNPYSRAMDDPKAEDITRDGKPYRRYTFPSLAGRNYSRWASVFTHWLPRPTDADRKAPGVFAWHYETPDGPEAEQTLPIKLLPELPALTAPKRILVRLWQSSWLNCRPDRLKPVLTVLQRSGFNTICWWESPIDNLIQAGAREMGLKIAADQSGHVGWPDMAKPSPTPDYQNRDSAGNDLKDQDPQWVIDTNGEPWKNDLAYATRHATKLDVMSEDIEWNTGGFDTGFSPAAIRAFAARNKLDAAALTPQLIWGKHRKQWRDFRAWQTLKLVELYHKAIKAGNPKVLYQFLPGSPYQTTDPDYMSEMIPLDKDAQGRMQYLIFPFPLKDMPQAMDVVMPMWYSHGVTQTRENLAWSKAITAAIKTPLHLCLLGQGREFYYPGGDPGEVLRAMNLAGVLGGAQGLCYWLGEFSPLQLSWLARCGREIAQIEDLVLDGRPDPAGISLTPMPKKRFTLIKGDQKQSFNVPDFAKVGLWRAYAQGNKRLVGVINLDQGLDTYYRLSVNVPTIGCDYRLIDVSENRIISSGARSSFRPAELKAGVVLRTPARYGVSLYLIAPESDDLPADGMQTIAAADFAAAYKAYREPDTTGAVLADRDRMTIRYDIVGNDNAKAILIETPQQQVWVRTQEGGRISDWKIKDGDRTVVAWNPPYGGAAADLFWSPADAHWAGDEISAYELVDAKIHGGKAYLRLRQKRQTPSLQGLVVTKTIAVPADRTDLEVSIEIENPGPAPEVGFSFWPHHEFQLGLPELEKSEPREHPQVFLKTAQGTKEAPLREIVWAKPDEPYIAGNESWEKTQRNGVTTGDWIAQRNPVTGEVVLCQVDAPPVAQFYSWRDTNKLDDLSIEWMHPYTKLPAGQTWRTGYVLRYVKAVKAEGLEGKLLPPYPVSAAR